MAGEPVMKHTRESAITMLQYHLTEAEMWALGGKSLTNNAGPDEFMLCEIADAQKAQAHAAVAQVYATLLSGFRSGEVLQ